LPRKHPHGEGLIRSDLDEAAIPEHRLGGDDDGLLSASENAEIE